MKHAIQYHYKSNEALPRPLATHDEIMSSTEMLCDKIGRKVVGVGPHFVVKYGYHINVYEGKVMLHVSQNTSVSVPKIYALYQDLDNERNYIVMERLQGRALTDAWPLLQDDQKEVVCAKLRAAFDEMCMLPSPASFCSLDKGPLPDGLFTTSECTSDCKSEDVDSCKGRFYQEGPFESERDLNDSLVRRFSSHVLLPGKGRFYQRVLNSIFSGNPPVFTHGDLQRKNIMVRFETPDESSIGLTPQVHVVVIDWETAGWYPSYREYAIAMFTCLRFEDDWHFWIDRILDPYLNEYAWMNMLLVELWT